MSATPRPGSYIKFAGSREDWLLLGDAEWEVDPSGWFMTCDLGQAHREPPAWPPMGDLVTATIEDHVARIEVGHEGEVIASGRIGLVGWWAVPDRVHTGEAYRRRGLGLFVMRRLLATAAEAGARRTALNATADGRELYRALGWTTVAQQTGLTRMTQSQRAIAAPSADWHPSGNPVVGLVTQSGNRERTVGCRQRTA